MPSVYEELFPNGLGKISEELYATVKGLCAIAQEIRESRMYQQDRDERIDAEREEFDQREAERMARETEEHNARMQRMGQDMSRLVYTIEPLASIAYSSTATPSTCKCGHYPHDESGCLICECKENSVQTVNPRRPV